MKIFRQKILLQKQIINEKSLSFVPTMGGLHRGHISLIKIAKRRFKRVIVSIYVNPKQFDSKNDFKRYPRRLSKDINLLKNLKVNYLYLPNYSDIYSFKTKNKIYLHKFCKKLCGKKRKNHFKGVVNVINRFLEIINPKYILLGNKDFQQLFLIQKHVEKNKINTKVISCNTIREKNGIACSSRNFNLNKKEIGVLSKAINFIKKNKKFMNKKKILDKLLTLGIKKIDYIDFLNTKSLKNPKNKKNNFNIFVAFYIGKTRLIDNF
tara:strand:+ start:147 stop:941 length:795 start_codon:yes stop_codon:yes gene_type:complete